MGEKEPESGATASGSGMATGLAAPGGGGAPPAEASNLNLSKSNIDRGMAGLAGSSAGGAPAMTGEDDWGAHTPSASEKWNVDATGPDVSAVGDAGAGAASIAVGEPGTNIPPGIAIGDPGVNGNISDGTPDPAEAAINNSHSNIKNLREMAGGGTSDPAPAAINTSHSGIRNLEGHASDGNDIAPGQSDPTPAEGAVVKSKSNINNNRNDE